MNQLERIELQYECLTSVDYPENTFLSVGTVTLTSAYDLHLDFNITETSWNRKNDGTIVLQTSLTDFERLSFAHEYKKLGFNSENFTYEFFADMLDRSYVTEVYTEYISLADNSYLPLTLKGMQLIFANGESLDYSDRISIFALAELAEVA